MQPHLIKSLAMVSSTLALSITLISCGGSSSADKPKEPSPVETFIEGVAPRFNPIISDIPFNTDIIFAKAAESDGTADLGAPTDAVRAAVNVLDGFSTSAYFDIAISDSINVDSVLAGKNVFLVELDSGEGDALDPSSIKGIKGLAQFDTSVASLDGGVNNTLRIRPTEPLSAKSKYLVIVTNGVKDSAGHPLTKSWSYNAIAATDFALPDALQPVRTAVHGWETLATQFLVALNPSLTIAKAKDSLVLTYTFTTTDAQAPLSAMASPQLAITASQLKAGIPLQLAQGAAAQLEAAGVLPSPKPRELAVAAITGIDLGALSGGALAANIGKLYTGYIELPYYLTSSATAPYDYIKHAWMPDLRLASMMGVDLPTDLDGSYNMTYRYPFAAEQSLERVPLQVTLPNPLQVPGYAGLANCEQIYQATGYPVVIYIHGITSDRSSIVALAHTLSASCIATVAIDLPLHGIAADSAFVGALNVEHATMVPYDLIYGTKTPHERHFNMGGVSGAPTPMNFVQPTATDSSGTQFMNLGYLANTRDNNRQAVMDLLNLNASLGELNSALKAQDLVGINLSRINVVGVSLGGILGVAFAGVNEFTLASTRQYAITSHLKPLASLSLSAAGAQTAQIIVQSPTFGPVIKQGLAASGVHEGTTNFERFVYTAQAMMDSADSVNFAQVLSDLSLPLLVQQIKDDQVILNESDSAPLMGTEPLAKLLGATQVGLGVARQSKAFVKVNAGGHTSLLRPEGNAPEVTAELQAQIVTLVLSGQVAVGSQAPTVIEQP